MTDIAALRTLALGKRGSAALARRAGPTMSPPDQLLMLVLAKELDAEAAGLEAQANELEKSL